jgi:hypothetical protein
MKSNYSIQFAAVALIFVRIVLWSSAARAQCTTPDRPPIAWWTGDEHADDIIGGHHGTWAGTPYYLAGKVDMAFDFNFDTGPVEVADDDELDFGPRKSMSIVFWAWRGPSTGLRYLLGKETGCSTVGFDGVDYKIYLDGNSIDHWLYFVNGFNGIITGANDWPRLGLDAYRLYLLL